LSEQFVRSEDNFMVINLTRTMKGFLLLCSFLTLADWVWPQEL